jgi:hypothetical protein
MEKLEGILQAWRATPPQPLALDKIKRADALQPRDPAIAPCKDRDRIRQQSEEHTEYLRDADALEPALVAAIDGGLYLVDGHHRWMASKRAGRKTMEGRVVKATWGEAVMVSKLCNLDGVKLGMHAAQRREALWQHLANTTVRGTMPLPPSVSLRKLAARFGVGSPSTVAAMLKRMTHVVLSEYSPAACDPGTGWPRWRQVWGQPTGAAFDTVAPNARLHARAAKAAQWIAQFLENEGPEALAIAVQLLQQERAADADMQEALAALATWTATTGASDT